jgi:hypothetical protein
VIEDGRPRNDDAEASHRPIECTVHRNPHGSRRRDGTTNQTIADSRTGIYEKQTKDLLLAEHVSKAREGGIWEQDQEHDEADGKPLIECGANDVSQRIGQSPPMNQAHGADFGAPTSALARAAEAEGSTKRAARLFEVPVSVVNDAVGFERSLIAA